MKKKTFSTELAYLCGIMILALGTAFMERADFGLSMVVAPAYLFHLKLSETFSWFTFGVAEYCLQAILLLITAVVLRKIKPAFLFSFITAVIYGVTLDQMIALVARIHGEGMIWRLVFYLIGLLLGSLGVAFLFHTYIAPEAYELLVKEVSESLHKDISKTKTAYDCTSAVVAIILSLFFFGRFEGVKPGTILCALVNGWTIGRISGWMEKRWTFDDVLPLRRYFQ